jgi:sugar phosphate isomerase/epimerase
VTARDLGPADLVLCAGTLQGVGFAARLAAARAGGFHAISLFPDDYRRARDEEKLGDGDLRAMLADHELGVADIDPLLNWVPGLESEFFGPSAADFFRIAGAVGARSINLALPLPAPLPLGALVSSFAGVCDRAAEHGLLVHLEALPWTAVPNVEVADQIVREAARKNGGLMLDAWHHFRSGTPNAALDAVDGRRVLAVQLSDAPATPDPDPMSETLRLRRLPGEGDIDLADLVRRLDAIGSRAPIGVEVFSESLAALPSEEVGRRAGARLREVVARGRNARPDCE